MLNHRSVILGVLGTNISGSISPEMHEQEGRAQGLSVAYRRLDLDQLQLDAGSLSDVLTWATRLGYDGLNITHPAKQAILPLLDELSDDARALGAVNTVVIKDGRTRGHNTDWSGFAAGLRWQLPAAATGKVVVVGAGGAGAAVAYALLRGGAGHLSVVDVAHQRAVDLVARLTRVFGPGRLSAGDDLAAELSGADGLVHATPTGMGSHDGTAVPEGLVRPPLWFADVVYWPLETELLSVARKRGCAVAHGGGMVVFQAVDAFELFTDQAPDADRMLRHFTTLVAASGTTRAGEV